MTPEAEHDRNLLEIEQIRATVSKMLAEQLKLIAERDKLTAEHDKLTRENRLGNFGVPAIATIVSASIVGLLGALVTLSVALLRHA